MRVLGIAVLALVLVLPAVAAAPIAAKLTTSGPRPTVDQPWRYTLTVRSARELVEKGGGTWDLHDVWGRRKLAYEIGVRLVGSEMCIRDSP